MTLYQECSGPFLDNVNVRQYNRSFQSTASVIASCPSVKVCKCIIFIQGVLTASLDRKAKPAFIICVVSAISLENNSQEANLLKSTVLIFQQRSRDPRNLQLTR